MMNSKMLPIDNIHIVFIVSETCAEIGGGGIEIKKVGRLGLDRLLPAELLLSLLFLSPVDFLSQLIHKNMIGKFVFIHYSHSILQKPAFHFMCYRHIVHIEVYLRLHEFKIFLHIQKIILKEICTHF